ncbi:MAG: prepilin-type N-terminal cleavage/methylation domain-containing protein [Candidatus Aminicenantes bacterium]|nr:prepilin-type N-terminal cleavage/methylation domain-containing protein [Candidatus Aminicenantes bacterium]
MGVFTKKRIRGFTLIELLISVAIIGILVAAFVPNALTAIHKSKQKGTMRDIRTIGLALTDYVTDNGSAPAQDGTYDGSSPFYFLITPFYVRTLPLNDKWGNGYRVWCGSAASEYGISGPLGDDFLIASYGRDRTQEGFTFNENSFGAGIFQVSSMSDFDKDLIMYNGNWIRYPRIGSGSGT